MNEEFNDQEISPVLRELADKVKAAGGTLVAYVEWEDGGSETTRVIHDDSVTGRVVDYAARTGGNVDTLIRWLQKDGQEHGHNSIYLSILDRMP